MQRASVFKTWVPNWVIKAVLIFCMLHSMVLLGLYTSNVTYAASFLDVEAEDLQYAMCITYGTFLATIFVESHLFKFFPTRSYFVTIYALAAICFVLSGYTHDYFLFVFLRILEGILMALPWIPLRILLLTRFRSTSATVTVFSLTYATLLLAAPFIMTIAVWLLENFDWNYMAYGSALFQLLCVALVLLTFNGHRFHRRIPLYQIDWSSAVLVLAAILMGSFVLVYGEKKYWFQSEQIVLATIGFAFTSGIFLLRQMMVKRPLFDVQVLQYANLRTGLVLFLVFYISRSTLNICHLTMSKVWNWEPERIVEVQYINVAGNAIGLYLAALLLNRQVATRLIFVIGFGLLALHHLWLANLFVPDLPLEQLAIPYLLQGVAVGILFVPLVLFTVSAVPSPLAPFAGTVGVSGRFWGNTLGFCIMQNAQVYLTRKNYLASIENMAVDGAMSPQRLGESDPLILRKLAGRLQQQAMLLTNMEIYRVVGILLVLLVLLLLVNRHLRKSVDLFRNSIWGT